MQKEKACDYAKKWTSVQSRIRGKSPPGKEERKIKIAHVFLQLFLNPNERNVFKRAKVELELDTLYTPIQHISYTCTSWFDCMT
jgi:hypothetical protein